MESWKKMECRLPIPENERVSLEEQNDLAHRQDGRRESSEITQSVDAQPVRCSALFCFFRSIWRRFFIGLSRNEQAASQVQQSAPKSHAKSHPASENIKEEPRLLGPKSAYQAPMPIDNDIILNRQKEYRLIQKYESEDLQPKPL